MVLFERYEGKPEEIEKIRFINSYRDVGTTFSDLRTCLQFKYGRTFEAEEVFDLLGIRELARYRLNRKLKSKVVAERIINQTQEIHDEQTAVAMECQKRRRERGRKEFSVPATPIT